MKKILGIFTLGFLLSSCSDIALEMIDQSKYINRALYPNETINLMGKKCVCLENTEASGIREYVIGYNDDKLGYIRYLFEFEPIQNRKISAHGNYFIYSNFKEIKVGRWEMNLRGKILINQDKNNTMRFHLKSKVYRDNNLEVKIKNNIYPKGKFFKIDLTSKNEFIYNLIQSQKN